MRKAVTKGLWRSRLASIDRLYEVSIVNNQLNVSVRDSLDGEQYIIVKSKTSPSKFRFELLVPSTGSRTLNELRVEESGTLACYITYGEVWKRVKKVPQLSESDRAAFLGIWSEEDEECPTNLAIKEAHRGFSIAVVQKIPSQSAIVVRNTRWTRNGVRFRCFEQGGMYVSSHELTLLSSGRLRHKITLKDTLSRVRGPSKATVDTPRDAPTIPLTCSKPKERWTK